MPRRSARRRPRAPRDAAVASDPTGGGWRARLAHVLRLETGPGGWQSRAVDRVIDRLPALLLLGIILLAVQVAVFEVKKPVQIVGVLPAAVLLFLYLRAGTGGKAGKSGKSAKAKD